MLGWMLHRTGADAARRRSILSKRRTWARTGNLQPGKASPSTRQGITFNPFLKTKLVGVLASSFLRCGPDNTYSKMYYEYKHRIENHPAHIAKTKGHRHAMALRYMTKRFLCDLYVAWRKLEGLPVELEYNEAKLGHRHAA